MLKKLCRSKRWNTNYSVDGPLQKVKLYDTTIFTYHPLSGKVVLRSGGWRVRTTLARINQCFKAIGSESKVVTIEGEWYVVPGAVVFQEGMVVE